MDTCDREVAVWQREQVEGYIKTAMTGPLEEWRHENCARVRRSRPLSALVIVVEDSPSLDAVAGRSASHRHWSRELSAP